MKKLVAMLALVAGFGMVSFGSACSDAREAETRCYLWDVTFKLKTVGPKYMKCKAEKSSVCSDATDTEVYYLDNETRNLKGYIWSCEYSCDTWNIVLWDEKNKVGVIKLDPTGENQAQVSAEDAFIYGKKAKKAAATFAIADAEGAAIDLFAFGRDGSLTRKDGDDCYVKSISGYACGKIAYVNPGYTVTTSRSSGSLCEDPVLEVEYCECDVPKCLTWCDACCFDGWCESGQECDDMLPCGGTWKMKFNKKLSSGKKGSIYNLVPAYAL